MCCFIFPVIELNLVTVTGASKHSRKKTLSKGLGPKTYRPHCATQCPWPAFIRMIQNTQFILFITAIICKSLGTPGQ